MNWREGKGIHINQVEREVYIYELEGREVYIYELEGREGYI